MSDDHDEPLQTRSRMFDELERQRQMHADIQAARLSGIPAATLAGLRDGSLVAVPREPTEAMVGAGWIDKEDVDPADIWHAMLAAAQDRTP